MYNAWNNQHCIQSIDRCLHFTYKQILILFSSIFASRHTISIVLFPFLFDYIVSKSGLFFSCHSKRCVFSVNKLKCSMRIERNRLCFVFKQFNDFAHESITICWNRHIDFSLMFVFRFSNELNYYGWNFYCALNNKWNVRLQLPIIHLLARKTVV